MTLRLPARRLLAVLVAALGLAPVLAACGPAPVTGNPSDYALNITDGQSMRWNPCAVVHWRADLRLAPPGALATVQQAVSTLGAATGITFAYDGTTSYIPQQGSAPQPAPLVISFGQHLGRPLGSNLLTGAGQIGEGGYHTYGAWNGHGFTYRITSGYVVVDSDAYRFRSTQVQTGTLLHELGHAVGLNHAKQTQEVMYPVITDSTATHYNAGDLTGLRLVGRPSGCI